MDGLMNIISLFNKHDLYISNVLVWGTFAQFLDFKSKSLFF